MHVRRARLLVRLSILPFLFGLGSIAESQARGGGRQPLAPDHESMIATCFPALQNQGAIPACLRASSDPTEGLLFPLGEDLFVAPDRRVGIATLSPSASLEVHGRILTPLTGTVSVAMGDTMVFGTGTTFTQEITAGAAIEIAGVVSTVLLREHDTLLHIDTPHPTGASNVTARKDGRLFTVRNAAGKDVFTIDENFLRIPHKVVILGEEVNPQPRSFNVNTSDVGISVNCIDPFAPADIGQTLVSHLRKETLASGDRNQIALGFKANDDGGGNPDRRFGIWMEAVVESAASSTKSAALRLMTPSSGANFPDERLRITGSGNVGIGTASPSARLHVVGDVQITGNLSKGSGSFRIDHPLDPENKYLSHSFVESPDMANVYAGNVVLGPDGTAVVELPAYFEALNRDFRYQLTPIGAPAALYVAEEIADNRFKVAGGPAGMKVSWQVLGTRQDAYANAHRIQVEEEKPAAERGRLLHPDMRATALPSNSSARR